MVSSLSRSVLTVGDKRSSSEVDLPVALVNPMSVESSHNIQSNNPFQQNNEDYIQRERELFKARMAAAKEKSARRRYVRRPYARRTTRRSGPSPYYYERHLRDWAGGTNGLRNMYGSTWATANETQKLNRQKAGFYGLGSYGSRIGAKVGSWIGNRVQGAITGKGMYTGQGSYAPVYGNTLMEGGDSAMQVHGVNDETEAIIFSHTEFISDVYGAPTNKFHIEGYEINPGVEFSFPWLSQIAANYEQFQLIQLVYQFKSTVNATTAGNGQTGTIMMATNYNADAGLFTDKIEMVSYAAAQSGRLTDDLIHGVECDPLKTENSKKFIRTGPVLDDLKNYDHGIFQLAQVNIPSEFNNQQVGELWVTYTVKLAKPKMGVNRELLQTSDRYFIQSNEVVDVSLTGTSNSLYLFTPPSGVTVNSKTNLYASLNNNMRTKWLCASGENGDILLPSTLAGCVEVTLMARVKFTNTFLSGTVTHDDEHPRLEIDTAGNINVSQSLLMPSLGDPSISDVFSTSAGYVPKAGDWHSVHRMYEVQSDGTESDSVPWSRTVHLYAVHRFRVETASGNQNNVLSPKIVFKFNNGTSFRVYSAVAELKMIRDDHKATGMKEVVSVGTRVR